MGWWRRKASSDRAIEASSDASAPAPLPASEATETDLAMMRRALEQARIAASKGETPVGAVVYETATRQILAEAHNTRQTEKDPCGHAELIAARAAAAALGDWRLHDCTLVVTLEPCAMCAGMIVNARFGRVVYGAADPKAGAAESLYAITQDARLNHRVRPIAGVLAAESGALLKEFFRARR